MSFIMSYKQLLSQEDSIFPSQRCRVRKLGPKPSRWQNFLKSSAFTEKRFDYKVLNKKTCQFDAFANKNELKILDDKPGIVINQIDWSCSKGVILFGKGSAGKNAQVSEQWGVLSDTTKVLMCLYLVGIFILLMVGIYRCWKWCSK